MHACMHAHKPHAHTMHAHKHGIRTCMQMEFKDLKEFLRFADVKHDPEHPVYGHGLLHHEQLPIRLATQEEYNRGRWTMKCGVFLNASGAVGVRVGYQKLRAWLPARALTEELMPACREGPLLQVHSAAGHLPALGEAVPDGFDGLGVSDGSVGPFRPDGSDGPDGYV